MKISKRIVRGLFLYGVPCEIDIRECLIFVDVQKDMDFCINCKYDKALYGLKVTSDKVSFGLDITILKECLK